MSSGTKNKAGSEGIGSPPQNKSGPSDSKMVDHFKMITEGFEKQLIRNSKNWTAISKISRRSRSVINVLINCSSDGAVTSPVKPVFE